MKYGEAAFDILYLLSALICGVIILKNARNSTQKAMGSAVLILGSGDAFHLVPRVISYFSDTDLSTALGIGKLITSLTMTIFYVYMFNIWHGCFNEKKKRSLTIIIYTLSVLRIILCLFPQNGWSDNSGNVSWAVIRNIPFTALGVVICSLYYKKRSKASRFSHIWLYVLLSFLFYIPVAVFASFMPLLGMLMIPKTICYVFIVMTFLLSVIRDQECMDRS